MLRLVVILTALIQIAPLPPAYPRVGATKILDNPRVQVWNIAWLKGQPSPLHRHVYDLVGVYYEPRDRHDRDTVVVWIQDRTPHAVWVPAGTVHSEEQTGVISEATIFELK